MPKVKPQISSRKLESYKRAEAVAQELRRQIAGRSNNIDMNALADFVIHWMKSTGNIKYQKPQRPKIRQES